MRAQDNTVSVTYRYIEKKTGISYQTVAFTMKALQEANLIKKLRTGTYQFNPDIIVKGGSKKRENLLIKYRYAETESKEGIKENKKETKGEKTLIGQEQ